MEPFQFLRKRCRPSSVVVVQDSLFFLDVSDVANARVLRAERGKPPAQYGPPCDFNRPSHITRTEDGGLIVTDTGNHRIMLLSPGAAAWKVIAGGRGPGARHDQLCFPRAVALSKDVGMYVADSNNHRVLLFPKDSTEGFVVAGDRGPGSSRDQLHGPCCVAVAPNKDLLIADTLNNRVVHYPSYAVEGTPLLDQAVQKPFSIAITTDGGVLVADSERLLHLPPHASMPRLVIGGLRFPQAVAVSEYGHLVVIESQESHMLYLAHRKILIVICTELSKSGRSLLAKLRQDIMEKITSFL